MAAAAFAPTRRNVAHWVSWAGALAVELALMGYLWDGQVHGWEQDVARAFQDVPGRDLVFDLSSTATNTISPEFAAIFVAIVGAAALLRQRAAATLLLLSFPLHVMAQFPKFFVDRPRPSAAFDGIEGVGGMNSFPSGHSEFVVTFYGFIAYLLMLRFRATWQRALIGAGFVILAMATGFGRVALGRHWPIDVLTSYVIGLGLLSGLIWLYSAYRKAKEAEEAHPAGEACYTGEA
jgi:membrane-associated phospholipid phosphatase